MTEKEQLEKIRKEVLGLFDQKQLLLLQVHELEMKKKYADLAATEAEKRHEELGIVNGYIEKEAQEKVIFILASAQEKESQFITKLQSLAEWEHNLAQEKHAQDDLSVSLNNRMFEVVDERKKFEKERREQLDKADTILESAKKVADEKLAALSRENSINAQLLSELTLRQEAQIQSLAGLQEVRAALEQDRKEIKDAWEAIELKASALEQRENDSSTVLGQLKIAQEDLERRAANISAMEKGIHEKEVSLDLKRREVDLLRKKTESLINIHKLEAEIASHS